MPPSSKPKGGPRDRPLPPKQSSKRENWLSRPPNWPDTLYKRLPENAEFGVSSPFYKDSKTEAVRPAYFWVTLVVSLLVGIVWITFFVLDMANVFGQTFSPHFRQLVALTLPSLRTPPVNDNILAGILPMPWFWYTVWGAVAVIFMLWIVYLIYVAVESSSKPLADALRNNIATYTAWIYPPAMILIMSCAYLCLTINKLLPAALLCTVLWIFSTAVTFMMDVTRYHLDDKSPHSNDRFSLHIELSVIQFLFTFVFTQLVNAASLVSMVCLWTALMSANRTSESVHYGFVGVTVMFAFIVIVVTALPTLWTHAFLKESSNPEMCNVSFNNRMRVLAIVWVHNLVFLLYFVSNIANASLGAAMDELFTNGMRNALQWVSVAAMVMQLIAFVLFIAFVYIGGNLYQTITWSTHLSAKPRETHTHNETQKLRSHHIGRAFAPQYVTNDYDSEDDGE
jgi:hypothetical protein